MISGSLAGLTFAIAFASSYGKSPLGMSAAAAVAVSTAAAGAVWLSGYRPLVALGAVVVLALGLPMFNATLAALQIVAVLVVFRAALESELRPWILASASLVALTVDDLWRRDALDQDVTDPAALYPLLLTGLAVGLGLRSRQVRRQHAELVALRDADRQRAVSDERRRIARDLHDVAAHHLSALVVRNKIARRLDTPTALAGAADFTAETAAATLESMRQVVRVLNTERDVPLAPSPRLSDLGEVVERMERAGLRIERQSADVTASPEVELALVRIAQEALANVLRHRGPGRCWLGLVPHGDRIELRVEDDGPMTMQSVPAATALPTGGYGVLGMRERAEACGGWLDAGPSRRGGWLVSATLPAHAP